tara:strand:+ start:1318 stop:1551 length:234 start_codon:yes stop_codon:yes gene_type:complete
MPRSDDLGCVSSTPWTHSNEEVLLTDSLNVEELEKKGWELYAPARPYGVKNLSVWMRRNVVVQLNESEARFVDELTL